MNKTVASVHEAIADVQDGATIMFGGFGLCGIPENMIRALVEKGVKELTVVSNNAGSIDLKSGGAYGIALLFENRQVRKFVGSFPGPVAKLDYFLEPFRSKELELEIMPQGTLNERIRCAMAGLGGVLTPVGVGTILAEGKETIVVDGAEYLLETPIKADFSFIKGYKGDRLGNLIYRYTTRNYNEVMAGAAAVTIAEVEELVDPAEFHPDFIHTPGVLVKRIFKGEFYEKRA